MSNRAAALDEALNALQERNIDPETAGGAVALEFLLRDEGQKGPPANGSAAGDQAPPAGGLGDSSPADAPLGAMSKWSGVDAVRLGDFFEFADELRLTIPSGRLPKSKADKQRLLVLLTVAADRVGNGSMQTDGHKVNLVVDDYAALDQNLGSNVAKNSTLIVRSGKPKAYLFRVTQPGLDRAREMIQGLAGGDEVLAP